MNNTSDTITAISAAFVQALGELTDVPKGREAKVQTKTGGGYGYKYADLADTLALVRPVLARHGLAVMQEASMPDDHQVHITTTVLHTSGEYITFAPLSMPAGRTAQETGSAITYGRRYSLLACLGLAAEDDDGAGAGPRQARHNAPGSSNRGGSAPKDRTRDDRGTSARTAQEGEIRTLLAGLDPSVATTVKAQFKNEYGLLKDLDPAQHAEALEWVQVAIAMNEDADRAWIAQAQEDPA